MSPIQIVSEILTDMPTAIQAVEALMTAIGDDDKAIAIVRGAVAAPAPAGPDVAADYESAKKSAGG